MRSEGKTTTGMETILVMIGPGTGHLESDRGHPPPGCPTQHCVYKLAPAAQH